MVPAFPVRLGRPAFPVRLSPCQCSWPPAGLHFFRNFRRLLPEPKGMDQRGSVTTEYVVILVLLSVGCSLAIVGLGPALVRAYGAQVTWLLLPFP